MGDLMARWQLPGGQVALAKDGRLVLNRGYGLADVERGEPVQPTSLFRIASVSKAITAVAILTLVDAGTLALDDTVFPLLAFAPPPHATMDPRLATITVQDLLVHAGGWDSAQSFDPQGLPFSRTAAAMVGLADPAEAATIVRFMLGEPLDFDPGTRQAYSNFGFNVLGRVIEHVSGQPYEAYVRDHVLTPAGITAMRLGRTRLADRARARCATTRRRARLRTGRSSGGRGMPPSPTGAAPTWRPSMPTAAGSRAPRTSSASRPRWTASGDRPCSSRRRSRP